jgi:hypothetical protein
VTAVIMMMMVVMMVVMMVMVIATVVIAMMVVTFHRHGIGRRRLDHNDERRQGERGGQKRRGEKLCKHFVSFQLGVRPEPPNSRLDSKGIRAKISSLSGIVSSWLRRQRRKGHAAGA